MMSATIASLRGSCLLSLLWLALGTGSARAEDAPQAEAGSPPLSLALGFGAGVGGRAVTVSEQRGESKLATRPFPALVLGLRGGVELRHHVSLGASIDYQTSVGLHVAAVPLTGDLGSARVLLRSHSLRAGMLFGYRLGARAASPRVQVFAGWMVRGLRSVLDLTVPAYTLHGPVLRPELELPISRGLVVLRGGPEAAVIVSASRELRELSGSQGVGYGAGGELAVDVRVVTCLHIVAMYRVLYISLSSSWSQASLDLEQFASLRAELHY